MPRWRKGEETITRLLDKQHLQRVIADQATARALVTMAEHHTQSAAILCESDPEGAFSLAYGATRKAATALLAHQGLRPTTAGGHLAVVDATNAQFPGVAGLKSLDRLRRRRNQGEYPDPAGYDPITAEEATDAVATARTTIDACSTPHNSASSELDPPPSRSDYPPNVDQAAACVLWGWSSATRDGSDEIED
jgi:HEPN domain